MFELFGGDNSTVGSFTASRRRFLKFGGAAVGVVGLGVGSAGTVGAQGASLSNDNIILSVNDQGSFTMQTTDGQDLLYPFSGTTYLTVRVGSTDYTTSNGGTSLGPYVTRSPTVTNGAIETTWELPEGLSVTQTITLEGRLAHFQVDFENTGSDDLDVDFRYLFDYQVAENDGSPIWVEGNVLTSEREFENPGFDSWQTYDQIPEPELVGQAQAGNVGRTEPDRIQFVHWPQAYSVPFDYTVDPSRRFYSGGSGDSAGLLYWEIGSPLPADGSETVSTKYGTGDAATVDPREALNFAFEDQTSEGDSVVVGSIFLSDGGFVAIHRRTADGGVGEVIGVSGYLEAETDYQGVQIPLDPPLEESQTLIAMPHLDTNGNQQYDFVTSGGAEDGPYAADGEPVVDPAEITLPGEEVPCLSFEDQTTDGKQVSVGPVDLEDNGFVAILDTDGDLLGVSDPVEAGTHDSIEVVLDDPIEEDQRLLALIEPDDNGNGPLDCEVVVGDQCMDDAQITVEETQDA